MKIYVASSWRNTVQPEVVELLRAERHDVYDFRLPNGRPNSGFSWSEVDTAWKSWTNDQYLEALKAVPSERGFHFDMTALWKCDACVLVLPCGRSAHLELGYAVGARKKTAILLYEEPQEPELMYKMVDAICRNKEELLQFLSGL